MAAKACVATRSEDGITEFTKRALELSVVQLVDRLKLCIGRYSGLNNRDKGSGDCQIICARSLGQASVKLAITPGNGARV
jgi:hypothetical protein